MRLVENECFDVFVERCGILASRIVERQDLLVKVLTRHQSLYVAQDEFVRATDCLRNAALERPSVHPFVREICVFLPLNLPLYSLVLFGIMPSLYAEALHIRPPVLLQQCVLALMRILDVSELFPHVHASLVDRATFVHSVTAHSDVVIFTGSYANAARVRAAARKDALFIYNGAGINPIVVLPDANVELAVAKTIEVKSFNSGQDCAGPDAILVSRSRQTEFVERLVAGVASLPIGSYMDPATRIGPLIDPRHIHEVGRRLAEQRQWIQLGGRIDVRFGIVEPSVVVRDIRDHPHYREVFAPIFFLNIYDDLDDLRLYFEDTRYAEHAMYASVFGTAQTASIAFGLSIPLWNCIILDVERGNEAFGGFGARASFVAVGRRKESRPILISREIQRSARQWDC